MAQLKRLYHTIRPLKWSQIWYRVVYMVQKRFVPPCTPTAKDIAAAMQLPTGTLKSLPAYKRYDPEKREFTFLNKSAAFQNHIDWNYSGHGLLWAYNLNYFEWLYDDTISVEARLNTIQEYSKANIAIGLDSYPTSLRIVAWVRFLLKYGYRDVEIFGQLFQHTDRLYSFPEYHLDGNHLWENAVALVCGGVFFRNEAFYSKGRKLIERCIREQLFQDGGHAEGSPMYHSLLLWRLLQCIELLDSIGKRDGLKETLEDSACKMLGWINNMTFSDGTWPAANDSTDGIAPSTDQLLDYAMQMGLRRKLEPLSDSGYRMIQSGAFELFINVGGIILSYQPGHSHADIGTYCLHYNGIPIIVDTGISTYEDSELRRIQRGTAAHNVVNINGANSSDVWKSFRLGKRVKGIKLNETGSSLSISYSGYLEPKVIHTRTFLWQEQQIKIVDTLRGDVKDKDPIMLIHLHPRNNMQEIADNNIRTKYANIRYSGVSLIELVDYEYCIGFNRVEPAVAIRTRIHDRHLEATTIITGLNDNT